MTSYTSCSTTGQDSCPEPLEGKRLAKLLSRRNKALRDGIQLSEATRLCSVPSRENSQLDLAPLPAVEIRRDYAMRRRRLRDAERRESRLALTSDGGRAPRPVGLTSWGLV